METWFKRTGPGAAATTGSAGIAQFIPLVTHGAPEVDESSNVDANWLLGIDDATDVLAADFEEGAAGTSPSLNHPVRGVTAITDDVWHHAAATYDGATWKLYLDGRLEASLAVGQPVRFDSIQRAGLGVMLESDGTAANAARFEGALDEVRVWAGARTIAQIQASVHQAASSGSGLVARWGMGDEAGASVVDSVAPKATGSVVGTGATRAGGGSVRGANRGRWRGP